LGGAGADGGLAFVEQEGGGVIKALGEGGESEAGGKGGTITQEAEQLQAERLAGLLVGGLYGEIRSDAGRRPTVGVDAPESHEVALVLGALQIAADEVGDLVEQGGASRGIVGFFW
jgi:hypothetical protein